MQVCGDPPVGEGWEPLKIESGKSAMQIVLMLLGTMSITIGSKSNTLEI